jgi:hypothetical protein
MGIASKPHRVAARNQRPASRDPGEVTGEVTPAEVNLFRLGARIKIAFDESHIVFILPAHPDFLYYLRIQITCTSRPGMLAGSLVCSATSDFSRLGLASG